MAVIHYAVEVETDQTAQYDNSAVAFTKGFLRVVTDRPGYTGTDTGADVIPTGDNSVIKINLDGLETIGTSFQSGQIYQASNGIFKSANTVINVGDRFTVQDSSDFTGGELAAAKGSAPAEGDMFEVTNNTSSSEAIVYVGINQWFEDFLTKKGLSNPSRRIDLQGTGDYGTLSGFNFQLDNSFIAGTGTPYWKTLKTNNVYLPNKKVRVYAVIGDSFYQIWQGIVDNNPIMETDYKFVCKSNFKAIHKDFPPKTINKNDFPNAIDDVRDKAIPVCLGDIEYANYLNTSGEPTFQDLNLQGGVTYNSAKSSDYTTDDTGTVLTLDVNKSITLNQFQDMYLFVSDGDGSPDTNRGNRIVSNTALSGGTIDLTLSEPLSGYTLASHKRGGSAGVAGEWSFRIADLEIEGAVSYRKISGFKFDENNVLRNWNYSSNKKVYLDIRHSGNGVDVGTSSTNATVKALGSNIGKDGTIDYTFPLKLTQISDAAPKLGTTFKIGQGTTDADKAKLIDFDRSTDMEFTSTVNPGGILTFQADFDMELDINLENVDFSEAYVGIDLTFGTALVRPFTVRFNTFGFDQYNTSVQIDDNTISTAGSSSVTIFNTLENAYYRAAEGGDQGEASFFGHTFSGTSVKTDVTIPTTFFDAIKNGVIAKRLRLRATVQKTGLTPNDTVDFAVKQVGINAVKSVDLTGTDVYTRISGELLDDDTTESNTVYKAFRRILESSDYDNIGTHLIDYGNLATTRDDWYLGKQIRNKANSFRHLKDLANESFVGIWQNRKGKIALSAWRENTTFSYTHDETNIIRESINLWKRTPIDKVFNNFTIRFSPNPGENSFFSQFQIFGVDDSSEKANNDPILQHLWDPGNAAFDVYGVVKEFKKDLTYFIDRNRWYNSDDTGKVGLGQEGSAFKFLEQAVFHLTRQRREVGYALPLNATNVLMELCDPIRFRDTVFTDAATDATYLDGHIFVLEYDLQKDQIKVISLIDPEDTIDEDFGLIEESGDAPDTITESGSQPDTITELGANN